MSLRSFVYYRFVVVSSRLVSVSLRSIVLGLRGVFYVADECYELPSIHPYPLLVFSLLQHHFRTYETYHLVNVDSQTKQCHKKRIRKH